MVTFVNLETILNFVAEFRSAISREINQMVFYYSVVPRSRSSNLISVARQFIAGGLESNLHKLIYFSDLNN